MKTVLDVQRRLAELGFDPGPLDGLRGRKTIAAVEMYQRVNHLAVDGIAGPATIRALFGGAPVSPQDTPDATPWLDIALSKKGLREKADNAELRAFLKSGGGTVGDPAKVPWCGDFVETCIAIALPREVLPNNPYAAMSWATWGRECNPQPGAILSFWRGSPDNWQGHVGFYVAEDATHFHVLGGNQSDAVTITRIAKTRLRKGGARWPLTALAIDAGARISDGSGLIETTNEA
ncbi:peptidoglycan-binding protein [Rhizobium oryzicola]|uniref:Peptidoglycan-binding protein n=1 Tax=Rhizobium oryzicola TaxID=1232668 RepID=A0ABT8SWS7_9HYPH|nr:peptidoglycan-binding protein [Rhizobium oryzicola]MDO1582441.1 peptidoglycan-binding protein [Rhizobium oryzicola]